MATDAEFVKVAEALLIAGCLSESDGGAVYKFLEKSDSSDIAQAEIDEMRHLIWPKYREQLAARGFDLSVTVIDLVAELLAALSKAHDDESISFDRKAAALYEDKYVAALVQMRHDRVAFEQAIQEIAKITGLGTKAVRAHVDKRPEFAKTPEVEPIPEGVSPEIKQKALKILMQDDPVEFIATACNRIVIGPVAKRDSKKLIYGIAVQDICQSAGLHFKASGESGGGKTLLFIAFVHHLPPEIVVFGGTSALAAVYHEEGPRLFRVLDDYRAGNETLDDIMKRTSSAFHKEYVHRTVKNMEPLTLTVGAEQTWAVTSVDSSQDIQNLNRQIPINVDDSDELTREVNRQTIQRYGEGNLQLPEDETVLVCREIWRILRSEGYINVRVPFWKRIEWLSTRNRRDLSIFLDMLVAHTAMFRYQREKDTTDGYYLATEADFAAAIKLFAGEADAAELVHRLSKKERQMADLLALNPSGLTRDEVAAALHVTPNRVSQLANGEKGKGGLSQTLSGFRATKITDRMQQPDGSIRWTNKTLYQLTDYDPVTGIDALVVLRPGEPSTVGGKDGKSASLDEEESSSKVGKQGVSSEVRIPPVSKSASVEEEEYSSKESKEEIGKETGDISDSFLSDENYPISQSGEENPYTTTETASVDSKPVLTGGLHNPYHPYNLAVDSGQESLPQAGGGFPDEYLDEVLVCRKIINAMIAGEDISDPVKLSEVCGIPVCIVARNAANYSIKDYHFIDQKKAGEILVTLDRASWWPPREMSPLVEMPADNESGGVANTPMSVVEAKKKPLPPKWNGRVIRSTYGREREVAPLAVNLFEGCDNLCKVCWAWRDRTAEQFAKARKVINLSDLEHDLQELQDYEFDGQLLFSFECDLYSNLADQVGLTTKALELCKKYGCPVMPLTKNGMKAARDFGLYGADDWFAQTMTCINDADSLDWEPNAALPRERIEAFKLANNKGINTLCMLEPVYYIDQSLEIIRQTCSYVDKYVIGKTNHVDKLWNRAGIRGLTAEQIKHLESIDWRDFGLKAIEVLKSLNKAYYIKKDLLAYLPEGHGWE